MFGIRSKKGFEMDMVGWLILGVIVLVIVVVGISILSGKGSGAIAYLKQIFSFGGRA